MVTQVDHQPVRQMGFLLEQRHCWPLVEERPQMETQSLELEQNPGLRTDWRRLTYLHLQMAFLLHPQLNRRLVG